MEYPTASSCLQVRAFAFAGGGLAAAERLHDRLLNAIVHAPSSFFDRTPMGRILNRFSSDTATADDSLPFIANLLLANLAALVGILAVLGYSQPLLLLLSLPLAVVYLYLQVMPVNLHSCVIFRFALLLFTCLIWSLLAVRSGQRLTRRVCPEIQSNAAKRSTKGVFQRLRPSNEAERHICGLQRYYRHTAREVRRLNSISRSPVYSGFSEALEGGPSIRAYNQQRRFCARNEAAVTVMQRTSFAGLLCSQLLLLPMFLLLRSRLSHPW